MRVRTELRLLMVEDVPAEAEIAAWQLKSAGLDVSISTVSDPEQSMMARRAEVDQQTQSPQAVEARPGLARPSSPAFLVSGDFD